MFAFILSKSEGPTASFETDKETSLVESCFILEAGKWWLEVGRTLSKGRSPSWTTSGQELL